MDFSRWWSERSEREPPDRARKTECAPEGARESGRHGSTAPAGADGVGARGSGGCVRLRRTCRPATILPPLRAEKPIPSPSQGIDQLIHLVRDRLHLEVLRRVVREAEAEVRHGVAVAARAGDGGVELALEVRDLRSLRGDLRGLCINERLERVELIAKLGGDDGGVVLRTGGVEWHGGGSAGFGTGGF